MYVLIIDMILYLITKYLWNARCGAISTVSGDPSFLISVIGNRCTVCRHDWVMTYLNSLHWKKQIWLKNYKNLCLYNSGICWTSLVSTSI